MNRFPSTHVSAALLRKYFMTSTARLFRNEEADYLHWIAKNPDGYVLNLRARPNRNYLMLHRASCVDISRASPNRGAAQFTGGSYAKLCASHPDEISHWLIENVHGSVSVTHLCQRCEPNVPIDEAAVLRTGFASAIEKALRDDPEARRGRLAAKSNKKPGKRYVMTCVFERDPDVVAEVLARAKGHCEGCGAQGPFRRKSKSDPYLEVHHRIPLSENGDDTVENALALCPNCHRHRHFGTEPWKSRTEHDG